MRGDDQQAAPGHAPVRRRTRRGDPRRPDARIDDVRARGSGRRDSPRAHGGLGTIRPSPPRGAGGGEGRAALERLAPRRRGGRSPVERSSEGRGPPGPAVEPFPRRRGGRAGGREAGEDRTGQDRDHRGWVGSPSWIRTSTRSSWGAGPWGRPPPALSPSAGGTSCFSSGSRSVMRGAARAVPPASSGSPTTTPTTCAWLESPSRIGGTWKPGPARGDRKSTRLNSSHITISYAVFCLKKKKKKKKKNNKKKNKKQ